MFGSPTASGRSELVSNIKVAIIAEITEAVKKTIVKEPENSRGGHLNHGHTGKGPGVVGRGPDGEHRPPVLLSEPERDFTLAGHGPHGLGHGH